MNKEFENQKFVDGIELFYSETKNNPYLPNDKQIELVLKAQENDQEARNIIIKTNQLLVASIAKKYFNSGMDFLDLVQYGNLGLNRAIDLYEIDKETKFSTYAYKVIESYIKRAISSYGDSIKIPLRFYNNTKIVLFIEQELMQKGRKEKITDEEIQEELINVYNISMPIDYLKLLRNYAKKTLSLNNYVSSNDEKIDEEIIDVIPSDDESVENQALNNVFNNNIRNILYGNIESKLTNQEKEVLILRFGFDKINQERTRDEVGKLMHVSRQRISQIEMNALRKLRKMAIINEKEKTIGSK